MSEQNNSKPRPRVIGPATLIALAAVAVIAYYNYGGFNQPNLQPRSVRADFKIPNEPDTAALINARDQLPLNSNQVADLGKILAEWQTQSAPAVAKMRTAYENMGRFLNAPPKKPPAMQDLMMKAGPLSDATAEYIKIRDAFQIRAIAVLTPDQKIEWDNIKTRNKVAPNEKENSSNNK